MNKSELIAALRNVPEGAEVHVAPGVGPAVQSGYWVNFPDAGQSWYFPGARDNDIRVMAVSDYDPDYNAVWLEL